MKTGEGLPEADFDAVLAEGPLELDPQDLDAVRSEGGVEGLAGLDPRDMPEVAIGDPQAWPLTVLYPIDRMPPEMRSRIAEAQFYIVRLHCSFRPKQNEIEIDWARFAVELLALDDGEPPRAEAMHPEEEVNEVATSRKLTLSPSLSFEAVDVSAGEIAFGIDYKALEPRVWGARDPPNTPSWDYQPTRTQKLQGSREMHLLVRAPIDSKGANARLHLAADLKRTRLIGRAKLRRDQAPLEATLWRS
jgi:hypothetical protein